MTFFLIEAGRFTELDTISKTKKTQNTVLLLPERKVSLPNNTLLSEKQDSNNI